MEPTVVSLLYAVLGAVVLIALVSIVGGFLQCRRERLLDHRERMRALELGRELPDDAATARIRAAFGLPWAEEKDGPASPAKRCFSSTFWIAFWGFLVAGQAGMGNRPVAVAIASSVGAIGVAGMICGTLLSFRAPAVSTRVAVVKPPIEEDAFDVVSCRG